MSKLEIVRAFEGDWTLIEPPAGIGDPTMQYIASAEPRESELNLKGALAIHQAGERYFDTVPGLQVVTFLSYMVGIPQPEESEVTPHQNAFYRALGSLGVRIMKCDCEPLTLQTRHPSSVYHTELESPAATFARTPNILSETVGSHRAYPRGPGYAVVRFDTQPSGFMLGWCDPVDGRRSEQFVDAARIMREHPAYEPKLSH